MVAAEARMCVAMQQAARTLGGDSLHERRSQDQQRNRMQRIQSFQFEGAKKLIGADDPPHALQENGGLADQWYLDDGDILCHPLLILPYLSRSVRCSRRLDWCRSNPRNRSHLLCD